VDEKHGSEVTKKVVASRVEAINFIETRVDEFGIECDFQRVPWHLFTTPMEENGRLEILKEHRAALEAGLEVTSRVPGDFPIPIKDIITIPGQAQFDPLVYTRELAANIASRHCQIFENSAVLDISDSDPCILLTENGTVRAKKVVMATHTPKGIYMVQAAMESKREFALAVRLKGPLPSTGMPLPAGNIPSAPINPARGIF
jgi:glycine/D-amino acid oxidase-like deaminating enzyme